MNNDLISIIVPAYNVEKYVKKSIESVLCQTYQKIEIICVNDGSEDNTLQVLQSIAATDKRIKVFSKNNEGVTKSRQFGVEQAQGEYIGFIDADDLVEPIMYERLIVNLKKHDADISHCGHVIERPDGSKEFFYNTNRILEQDRNSGIVSLISGHFEPSLCNKLYKNTLLHDLFNSNVLDDTIKINEDLLMNYYLFKTAKRSVLEDNCYYHYIKREGSASTSAITHKFIWDQIHVKQIILSDSMGTSYENEARRAHMITCVLRYNSLLAQDRLEFFDDVKQLRMHIKKHQSDIKLTNKKFGIGAWMIIYCPKLYSKLIKLFL